MPGSFHKVKQGQKPGKNWNQLGVKVYDAGFAFNKNHDYSPDKVIQEVENAELEATKSQDINYDNEYLVHLKNSNIP